MNGEKIGKVAKLDREYHAFFYETEPKYTRQAHEMMMVGVQLFCQHLVQSGFVTDLELED